LRLDPAGDRPAFLLLLILMTLLLCDLLLDSLLLGVLLLDSLLLGVLLLLLMPDLLLLLLLLMPDLLMLLLLLMPDLLLLLLLLMPDALMPAVSRPAGLDSGFTLRLGGSRRTRVRWWRTTVPSGR
jgi:hypothetical protein